MMYHQVLERDACMPLLMGYARPEKIEEADEGEAVVYDHVRQFAVVYPFVMRTVGTYSLKSSQTKVGKNSSKTDKKNAIDDQKTVK